MAKQERKAKKYAWKHGGNWSDDDDDEDNEQGGSGSAGMPGGSGAGAIGGNGRGPSQTGFRATGGGSTSRATSSSFGQRSWLNRIGNVHGAHPRFLPSDVVTATEEVCSQDIWKETSAGCILLQVPFVDLHSGKAALQVARLACQDGENSGAVRTLSGTRWESGLSVHLNRQRRKPVQSTGWAFDAMIGSGGWVPAG